VCSGSAQSRAAVSAQANQKVLLVTFPDRLLLLDPDAHTHTALIRRTAALRSGPRCGGEALGSAA
jgi:hypothetical protein